MSKIKDYKGISNSFSHQELEIYINYIKQQSYLMNKNILCNKLNVNDNINILSFYKRNIIDDMIKNEEKIYIDKYIFNVGDAINKTKYLFGKSILELLKVTPTNVLLNKMYKMFSGYYFDSIMFYGLDDIIPKGFKFSYSDIKYIIEKYNLNVVITEEDYDNFTKKLYKYFRITLNKDSPSVYVKFNNDKFIMDSYSKTYIKLFDISRIQINNLRSRYKGENFYKDVVNLLFIYSSISSVNNHLSIPPLLLSKLNIDVELFGTPLNTTLNKFCSPFYSIEKNFGSQGNFFDFTLNSNKNYTYNPPYVDELMFEASKYLKTQINNINNYFIVGVFPAWEKEFRGFDVIKSISTFKEFTKLDHEEYSYYDYYSDSLIPVCHTFLFIITDREEYKDLNEIKKEWKNSLELYHKNR